MAAIALNIHLCARLGEREVVRTETDDRVLAVQLLCEQLKDALEVAHTDALVNDQTLDLMEQGRVGSVNSVRAVNAARRNDADRRLALFHRADLHRGCLGTQNDIVRDIEGVLRVARRMILRDVQRLEVVVVELDLRAFRDREAKTEENLLELVEDDVQRMLLANHDLVARKGNVNGLSSELFFERRLLEQLFLLVDDGLDLSANVVDELADNRALLRSNVLHTLEQSGQLALLTEELDTRFIEGACIRCRSKLLLRGLQNALQLFFHINSPLERDVHAGTETQKSLPSLCFCRYRDERHNSSVVPP